MIAFTCVGLEGRALACRLSLHFSDQSSASLQLRSFEHEWIVAPETVYGSGEGIDHLLIRRRALEEERFIDRVEELLGTTETRLVRRDQQTIVREVHRAA